MAHGAARGVDVPCAVCEGRIRPDQVEYELQFAHDGATPGVDLLHLHLRCFAAWEMERTKGPDLSGQQAPRGEGR